MMAELTNPAKNHNGMTIKNNTATHLCSVMCFRNIQIRKGMSAPANNSRMKPTGFDTGSIKMAGIEKTPPWHTEKSMKRIVEFGSTGGLPQFVFFVIQNAPLRIVNDTKTETTLHIL
jgi:hypothetical protein